MSNAGDILKLSPRQYAESVDFLRRVAKAGNAAAAAELRRTTRMEVWSQVRIHAVRDGASRVAMARDISIEGIGLFSGAPIPKGEELLVLLGEKSPPMLITANVVFCGPIADGVYQLGCQFTALATPEQVARFQQSRAEHEATMARLREAVIG